MVDYSKYKVINYFQYEPPEEYDRKYFIDEFNKISHAIDQFAQEYYPSKNASSQTGDYTATVLDDVLLCSGNITVTLYDAAGQTDANGIAQNAGRRITIKNIGTGQITIDGAGTQTIDGETTCIINKQYVALELFSDGSNWYIV
jgi:hypothetical protein